MGIVTLQIRRKIPYRLEDRIDGKGWFIYRNLEFMPYVERDKCMFCSELLQDFEPCGMWIEFDGKPYSFILKGFYYRNQLDGYDTLENVFALDDLQKRTKLIYDALIDYRAYWHSTYKQRFVKLSSYMDFKFNESEVFNEYNLIKSCLKDSDFENKLGGFKFIFSFDISENSSYRLKLLKDYAVFKKFYNFMNFGDLNKSEYFGQSCLF